MNGWDICFPYSNQVAGALLSKTGVSKVAYGPRPTLSGVLRRATRCASPKTPESYLPVLAGITTVALCPVAIGPDGRVM